MNRERAKELLPIIKAFSDGKDVQIKNAYGKWITVNFMREALHSNTEWRIKPEQITIYAVYLENKDTYIGFTDMETAKMLCIGENGRFIEFIEVADDE